jgi:glycosyltransferase involved in cell wall biosynthesis
MVRDGSLVKVDLVTPRFHPSVGGIEESVAQLAFGLIGQGHDVVVHTAQLPETPISEVWRKVPIRRYPLVLDRGFYVSRFEPVLEGDLIHLHAYAHQTNDWVIERNAGEKPIVYSTHHGIKFPKPRLLARIYHWWYNRRRGLPNLRRVQAVLVPTKVDRDEFARRGVEARRIHVVPSGVDEEGFARHRGWRPADLKGDFFLYLGRLHKEKGVVDLVRAYAKLRPRQRLLLAGKDEGALRHAAPLPDGVHVLHRFDAAQKWGLLESCRALVLPSHYEGQGIVVAEAWAKHKPVIATRAGGLAAVVQDGRTGLLVDVRDQTGLAKAMARLAEDDALAKRLGEAGAKHARAEYRWPVIVEHVVRLYRDAAKARR